MTFHAITSSIPRNIIEKYHRQMTPMQRLLKDLRNPLLTKQTTEALEDSYLQLERAWLHARMYEAMEKRMEDIDEIVRYIYEK